LNSAYAPLIETRIRERFETPDWKDLDIIHSSTMTTGMTKPRKIHLLREAQGVVTESLLDLADEAQAD
jgi:hypothetical protein